MRITSSKQTDSLKEQIKWLDWRIAQEEARVERKNPRLLAGLKHRRLELANIVKQSDALFLHKGRDLPDLALLFSIGEMLTAARMVAGISQRSLAELVGWDRQQIQRYERNGYADCSVRRLQDVAAALISKQPRFDGAPPPAEAYTAPSVLPPVRLPEPTERPRDTERENRVALLGMLLSDFVE